MLIQVNEVKGALNKLEVVMKVVERSLKLV